MNFNIVLVDNSPHIQKTLNYFLYCYHPNIYHFDSVSPGNKDQNQPDLIFLDENQLAHQNKLSTFQTENHSPPVILLFTKEENIKKSLNHQGQLKKPIDPNQLHDVVCQLVPKLKTLQVRSFLKYNPSIKDSSVDQKMHEKIQVFESSNLLQKKASDLFPSAISIPSDLDLIDETDMTKIQNSTALFKNITSQIAKKSTSTLKQTETHQEKMSTFNAKDTSPLDQTQASTSITRQKNSLKNESNQKESINTKFNSLDHAENKKISTATHFEKPLNVAGTVKPEQTNQTALMNKSKAMPYLEKEENSSETTINQSVDTKHILKELTPIVRSQVETLFVQSIKEMLEKKGIRIIKKVTEDISWKMIPEISKNIIQKEIEKIKIDTKKSSDE